MTLIYFLFYGNFRFTVKCNERYRDFHIPLPLLSTFQPEWYIYHNQGASVNTLLTKLYSCLISLIGEII